jgi:lipopolysaccharide export system protein LptA
MMVMARLPKYWLRRLGLALVVPAALIGAIALPFSSRTAIGQTSDAGRALRVLSDEQFYDARTGVVTARGNVRMSYPARQIQATAAQAQYFSRERRIVLSGNVFVLQQGNSIRGETVVYLIDEGLFQAVPQPNRQVESIYIVPANAEQPPAPAPATPNFRAPQRRTR